MLYTSLTYFVSDGFNDKQLLTIFLFLNSKLSISLELLAEDEVEVASTFLLCSVLVCCAPYWFV